MLIKDENQTTVTFRLRNWQEEDAESLALHADNPRIACFMTDQFPHPYSLEQARAFIERAAGHEPARFQAIEVDGQAVGGIGVHPQSDVWCKNAELGYWLSEKYWGKGVMTAAVKQMTEYAFRYFDIDRLFAKPFGNNDRSRKVLEKAGFVLEATIVNGFYKNGEYQDELIYAVWRQERERSDIS